MPDIGLKPCPFCGGKAVIVCQRHFSSFRNVGFEFNVKCESCKITLDRDFKIEINLTPKGNIDFLKDERQEAANMWNRRAADDL